ncbi:MAG: hypothetical protein Q4P15_02040 [Propionibacteriaceae bacterium]|nr:hypothetical protein [Propionibacteriaceae bacterium]
MQDVVNNVVNKVSDFVHGAPDAGGGPGGRGEAIAGHVASLRNACETAKQRDKTEAAFHWATSMAGGPITAAITAARMTFDSKAGALTQHLDTEMNALDAAVKREILPHLGAPSQLRGDAKHWVSLASRVQKVQNTAKALVAVDGWSDKASPEYAKAVSVQVGALASLSAIMDEVAVSCRQGAMLNDAGFEEVVQELLGARNKILGSGSGGGSFYQRTAAAIHTVVTLRIAVDPELLKSLRAAIKIDEHSSRVLSSTDLPADHWPGGNAPTGINA